MEIKNTNIDINYLEQKMTLCSDLLEIAKTYCEFAYDKKNSVSALGSIIDVILTTQREIADRFDSMLKVG